MSRKMPEKITFGEIAERYLATLKPDLARSTWLSYQSSLNHYWLPRLGRRDIRRINHAVLLNAWDDIQWESRKTAKNNLVPLHGVFSYAFERGVIDDNPARRIRVRRLKRPRIDPFTHDEKLAILARLQRDHEPTTYLFFLTAFELGARTGEMLALQWADYDGKGFRIHKTMTRRQLKNSTKTGIDRYVFANLKLRAALDAARSPNPGQHVFLNSKGTPMLDADWVNVRWRTALEREKIRYRRAYNCRHTYATLGLMAGLGPALLAQQLGHSLQVFHRNYATWITGEQDEQAILQMETFWDAQADKDINC